MRHRLSLCEIGQVNRMTLDQPSLLYSFQREVVQPHCEHTSEDLAAAKQWTDGLNERCYESARAGTQISHV